MVARSVAILFLSAAMLLCALSAFAGGPEVRATAKVDSTKILIGDQIHLVLEVDYPNGVSVQWPSLPEVLKPFDIVSQGKMETVKNGAGLRSKVTVVLTTFTAGTHVIPALNFSYSGNGASAQTTATSPLTVEVRDVKVDTTKDIKDVKPPREVPLSWREVLPYVLAGLAGVILLFAAIYIWKKRKKGETLIPAAPPRPPRDVAIEALRVLEAKRLWQNGKVKEHHSELTDIIRTYIERRFETPAMEMTTEDIFISSFVESLDPGRKKELKEMLTLADSVKFAKFLPAPDENERSLRLALSFVETTAIPTPAAAAQFFTAEHAEGAEEREIT